MVSNEYSWSHVTRVSEKFKSIEMQVPKPCLHWDAAGSGWDPDGIAHCCKRTGKGGGCHGGRYVVQAVI